MSEKNDTKINFKNKKKTNSNNSNTYNSIHYNYNQNDPSKNPLHTNHTLNQINDQLNKILQNQPTKLIINQNPVNIHITQTNQLI